MITKLLFGYRLGWWPNGQQVVSTSVPGDKQDKQNNKFKIMNSLNSLLFNSGFQHIVIKIISYLDIESFMNIRKVNKTFLSLIDNELFLWRNALKQCIQLTWPKYWLKKTKRIRFKGAGINTIVFVFNVGRKYLSPFATLCLLSNYWCHTFLRSTKDISPRTLSRTQRFAGLCFELHGIRLAVLPLKSFSN